MKTLYIVRHAKSSWDYPHLKDYERPILGTGVKRTKKLIAFFKQKHVKLDYIVSSHATRAIETAQLIAKGMDYPSEHIYISPHIYQADADDILDVVYALPDDKNHVLMVGHNPTFTQFANNFLAEKIHFLPTSAVVSISFETDAWPKITSSPQLLNFVVFPKNIKL